MNLSANLTFVLPTLTSTAVPYVLIVILVTSPLRSAVAQTTPRRQNLAVPPKQVSIPKVTFLYPPPYGTVFDRTCPQFLNTQIKPEWVQETVRRLPEFQSEWNTEGPKYLSVVFNEIRLKFPYDEMQAVLTVCPVSTMSMPLMINVRRFLVKAQDPAPAEDFSEVVFHELMHHYVSPLIVTSALRKKYATEPPVTLYHLHVMALEVFALLKLGKFKELDYLNHLYRTDPAPSYYKRAWQIVNDIEGYRAFVNELKTGPNGLKKTAIRYPALRRELLDRVQRDQAIRRELITKGAQHPDPSLLSRMQSIDAENTRTMKGFINRYGWPTDELIGRDGVEAGFLIVQHADHDFQKQVLPLVQQAHRSYEISCQDYALLLDRVLVGDGKLQVYGTQAKPFDQWKGTVPVLEPIEDEVNVDKRRVEVGLPPLSDYLNMLKDMYFPRN